MTGSPEPNAANADETYVFTADDIPRLTLPYRDGVIVYRPTPSRPDEVSAATEKNRPEPVEFIPADRCEAAQVAIRLARRAGAGSVVVHPRFSPAARTALAIAFAAHLSDARRADDLDPNVVTTACAPDLRRLPGHIRVPHLLTVSAVSAETSGPGHPGHPESTPIPPAPSPSLREWSGTPHRDPVGPLGTPHRGAFSLECTERTIWEIMSIDACRAWLGGASPDLHDVVEANLPALLMLRRLLRRPGFCEHLPNGRRIREVLADADDEDLTILRIYRDPDVFLPAACAAADIPALLPASPPGYRV